MPHVYCGFLVLESFDEIQDVLLDFLNMLGVNIGRNLTNELHEDGDRVGADKREGDAEVRVVLLQLDLLEVLLDAFIDLVRDLPRQPSTAFSGRKRNSLKTSMKRVPKGMISIMARM